MIIQVFSNIFIYKYTKGNRVVIILILRFCKFKKYRNFQILGVCDIFFQSYNYFLQFVVIMEELDQNIQMCYCVVNILFVMEKVFQLQIVSFEVRGLKKNQRYVCLSKCIKWKYNEVCIEMKINRSVVFFFVLF